MNTGGELTDTTLLGSSWDETVIARTSEASKCVDAFTIGTQVWCVETIINILTIRSESHTMRTHFHEGFCYFEK